MTPLLAFLVNLLFPPRVPGGEALTYTTSYYDKCQTASITISMLNGADQATAARIFHVFTVLSYPWEVRGIHDSRMQMHSFLLGLNDLATMPGGIMGRLVHYDSLRAYMTDLNRLIEGNSDAELITAMQVYTNTEICFQLLKAGVLLGMLAYLTEVIAQGSITYAAGVDESSRSSIGQFVIFVSPLILIALIGACCGIPLLREYSSRAFPLGCKAAPLICGVDIESSPPTRDMLNLAKQALQAFKVAAITEGIPLAEPAVVLNPLHAGSAVMEWGASAPRGGAAAPSLG